MIDIFYLIYNFFNTIILYKICNLFVYKSDVKNKKMEIISFFIYWVVISFSYYILKVPFLVAIESFLITFFVTFNYKINIKNKIFLTISLYSTGILFEIMALNLNNNIGVKTYEVVNLIFSEMLVKTILFFLFYLFLKKILKMKLVFDIPIKNLILLGVILIFTILLNLVAITIQTNEPYKILFILLNSLVINISVFYLYNFIYYSMENKMENILFKEKQKIYIEKIENMNTYLEEMNSFKHDLKNHLICIKDFVEQKNYKETSEYIENIFNINLFNDNLIKTENIFINSILNLKVNEMKKYDIKFDYNIIIPKDYYIEAYDIVTILGNLLDNAIEANKFLEKGKFINLDIELNKDRLFIKISNSFDGIIKYDNKKQIMTKKNKGGIGLKNVKNVVKKYKGFFDINTQENKFTINIILYNKVF